jgi:flagellar biosynthesis protein FlhG
VNNQSIRSGGQKNIGHKISTKTPNKPLVISISSGKGGVGKTLTTVNFAIAASMMGHRVLVFDGDLGLANVDVVLGLHARYNIRDVLDGQVKIEDIMIDGPAGIKVIPSGSGISKLQQLSYVQKQVLSEELSSLDGLFDIIFIDTGAGISDNVIHLNKKADKIVVVTTPEPHAMTDAYALIKVLEENTNAATKSKVGLLVNMARTDNEAENVAKRLSDVAQKFIQTKIEYLGRVPHDPQVTRSILVRKAASENSMHNLSGQAWNRIAKSIIESFKLSTHREEGGNFWQNLLWSEEPEARTSLNNNI